MSLNPAHVGLVPFNMFVPCRPRLSLLRPVTAGRQGVAGVPRRHRHKRRKRGLQRRACPDDYCGPVVPGDGAAGCQSGRGGRGFPGRSVPLRHRPPGHRPPEPTQVCVSVATG